MSKMPSHNWASFEDGTTSRYCSHCGLIEQNDTLDHMPCVHPNNYHRHYKTAPRVVSYQDLRTAFELTCDSCGKDFLVRAELRRYRGEEMIALMNANNLVLDPDVDRSQLYIEQRVPPAFTTCHYCRQGYVFTQDTEPLPGDEANLDDLEI